MAAMRPFQILMPPLSLAFAVRRNAGEKIVFAGAVISVILLLAGIVLMGLAVCLAWVHLYRRADEVGCSRCGSNDIRRCLSRGLLDHIVARAFCMPFHCRACRKRFYLYVPPKVWAGTQI
jgi:hypothetical protein